jgi:hypothetical protein
LLASTAREILTALGVRMRIPTFLDHFSRGDPTKLQEGYRAAYGFTNFLKHADRDPADVLVDLTDDALALGHRLIIS